MKSNTLLDTSQAIPERLQQKLDQLFPGKPLSDLIIRYYSSVEDVGREYFAETVLSACGNRPAAHFLEPFISFVGLGEAVILAQKGTVIYDTDHDNDSCTETGPFWFVRTRDS
ncbi:MAG TPA: hypothetical protein IGS37_13705 [Synechococcales cyanobacterium M55_K2018_004]|nr:hypothetical protein [Synechococcales cyanobacterium M55_K2018_004]